MGVGSYDNYNHDEKPSHHDANFVLTCGTKGCHNNDLPYHHGQQIGIMTLSETLSENPVVVMSQAANYKGML